MSHPFETLTPDVVMDALDATGLRLDGRLMALSSYENRVYMAHLEQDRADGTPGAYGEAVVVKFYRPQRWTDAQILEEHSFAQELQAFEVPLAAPIVLNGQTLHHHAGFSYSVSPRMGGRRPELDDFDTLEWIGRFLARIHTVGAAKPFATRPALNVDTFATEPHDWLLAHHMIPLDVQSEWEKVYTDAMQLIAACAHSTLASGIKATQKAGEVKPIAVLRLHGDCHPGNILWTPSDLPASNTSAGPHFVDLDDARTGPAVQDFWMLLDGDRRQRTQQLSALLDGYEQFRPFDRRELALIEPLRTLRLIHYSAWLARRWDDPAFPIAFPDFGTRDYWQGQVALLREQVEQMQEVPLSV